MNMNKKKASILKKFLIFNLFVFLILGLFTFFYLEAIQPNLVKQRTEKHNIIIVTFLIDFKMIKRQDSLWVMHKLRVGV